MIDTTSLFLHVLAAIGILAGGTVQVLARHRVRAAATGRDLATWAGFARHGGIITLTSAAVSLLTGGHLAGAVWGGERGGFANPFISLGLLGLLLLAPVGPVMGGARLRRLVREGDRLGGEPVPADLCADANAPILWGAVHSLVGVAVGLVALMVYKPGWLSGATILVLSFGAGWAVGLMLSPFDDGRHAGNPGSPVDDPVDAADQR